MATLNMAEKSSESLPVKQDQERKSSEASSPPHSAAEEPEGPSAPPAAPTPPGPPALPGPFDSGLLPWMQVVGTFAIWTNSWGLFNSFGEFQTYYQSSFLAHKSADDIAWIGSLQAFFLLFLGTLSGPLYDAGYFRHLLIAGNFCIVLGMMMTSLCTEYWQLILAQSILVGCGFGLLFTPSTAIIPQWFQARKAVANGLAASGSGFGGVIYCLMFRKLQPAVGFAWTTRIMAFVALFCATISLATMRNKIPRAPRIRALVQLSAFKEAPYTLYGVGAFFVFMGIYPAYFFIQPYALAHGHGLAGGVATYLVVLINVGNIIGRIALSFLADRFGIMNVATLSVFCSGLLVLCWIAISSVGGLVAFALLYGIAAGTYLSLAALVVVPLTTDLRTLGTRIGQLGVIGSVAVLIGTPISGALLKNGGFVGLQAFAGVALMVGFAWVVVARGCKVGWWSAVRI